MIRNQQDACPTSTHTNLGCGWPLIRVNLVIDTETMDTAQAALGRNDGECLQPNMRAKANPGWSERGRTQEKGRGENELNLAKRANTPFLPPAQHHTYYMHPTLKQ